MKGILCRSLQGFVEDTCGPDVWMDIATAAELDPPGFELLLSYSSETGERVLVATENRLNRSRDGILEDMGHYLVTNERVSSVRRLLRFGGDDFVSFLESLEELPERARLAMDHIQIPRMRLEDRGSSTWELVLEDDGEDFAHVVLGALRAMADDYGALALLGLTFDDARRQWRLEIVLLSDAHSTGRDFHLGTAAQ